MNKLQNTLQKVYDAVIPEPGDLLSLLSLEHQEDREAVFSFADQVRKQYVGDGIILRGLIEFSNFCDNSCFYCGLNKDNRNVQRYCLSKKEIMESVACVVASNIKTVVLQSGEDANLDYQWLAGIIKEIKSKYDVAVTLSVGEHSGQAYRLWKDAGADRYLLKIETSDKALYESLHCNRSFEKRTEALHQLKCLGYQVGSGVMVGLQNQTMSSLANDILFFKKEDFDMIGIGPFIPHVQTALASGQSGDVQQVLMMVALTRIVTKDTNIPATTALGSLEKDYRSEGLRAGANILMPNFTPLEYRELYQIYPGKRCLDEKAGVCVGCMEMMAQSMGREVSFVHGHRKKQGG